ncbi:MAG TPA: ATP-binding cassette domain-containing protein [Acidimicrobiales bacterium]|jgi:ABC-type multidrug transport system ATPase subunit|nr:ATP-binding cassette domain-containing protein [Acidimicrobiales bacterium]
MTLVQDYRSVGDQPDEPRRFSDRLVDFATARLGRSRPVDLSELLPVEVPANELRARLPLAGATLTIGSEVDASIRLVHPLIRSRHARVGRAADGQLWIEEQAAVDGTHVNGQRLRGRRDLALGDIVQIGPFSARIGHISLDSLEQVPGVDVSVVGASVDVRGRRRSIRRLLDDVSLSLRQGSLTAIAGPSGSGKTTLMRLLSGQVEASQGSVHYDGVDLAACRKSQAHLMGFVPQDDIVHSDLTVGETLGYQARLRLGKDASPELRQARIERALSLVGLDDQRDQIIKSLSGGQRKRVSIASELLSEPKVLFLDEPTSGLDPGLDKQIMLLLRLLADQGRTVVLATHSLVHVDVCDTLALVGPGGHIIYTGKPDEAPAWFGVHSLGDTFSLVETPEAAAEAATRVNDGTHTQVCGTAAPAAPEPAKAKFGSPPWRRMVRHQGSIFAERYCRLLSRDRTAITFSLLQGVAVALLTAMVASKPMVWNLKGHAPVFVFGCAAVWFGMLNSVRELVKERTIWRREQLVGGNTAAYLTSKLGVLGALGAFQTVTSVAVLAFTLGLPNSGTWLPSFVGIGITLFLANLTGMAIGLLVSSLASSSDRAMSIVPYLLISQLVLCGVLFPLRNLAFISWFIPAHWAVSAVGGIAGLNSGPAQTGGLYPHSLLGVLGPWAMLIALAVAGVMATAKVLDRQAASWSVG